MKRIARPEDSVFPHGMALAMMRISLQDINAHQSVVNIVGGNPVCA